ncbi:MAG: PLP-dependent cysteine synthase family protein [Planctomycetaceae bacterium]|nr:PLP-dependent cysteine synthase family protein [Planctomycetaceae bacterium]
MTILETVGRTPLLPIFEGNNGARIFAKAEFFNPSGSVKDRAVKGMLVEAIKSGKLTKTKTILDATSGNTGIAYAMFGAALGYKVLLCLPANASKERKRLLNIYRAEIVATNPMESSDGALLKARQLYNDNPGTYYYPDQYSNDENWKAHYNGTAVEIWEQTDRKVTHFVAGMGTSGTFTGTARRLKEFNPSIKTVPMQPESPLHGLEGMKHMASTILPGFYDPTLFDGRIDVSTEEAKKMTRRLAEELGLFVGISSGANVLAAVKLAETLSSDAIIVTILCDSGNRYLSDELWD